MKYPWFIQWDFCRLNTLTAGVITKWDEPPSSEGNLSLSLLVRKIRKNVHKTAPSACPIGDTAGYHWGRIFRHIQVGCDGYPLVNIKNYGKSSTSIGKSTINVPFSIATEGNHVHGLLKKQI